MRMHRLGEWARRRLARAAAMASILTAMVLPAAPARAQADEDPPQPWTGMMGITETVDQIMARDHLYPPPQEPQTTGKPRRIRPDRSRLPNDPGAIQGPTIPPLPPGVWPVGEPGVTDDPQTLGTNFLGAQLSESGFIPPDTMGDVGLTQILVAVNGRIKVFNKSGTLGSLNTTMNSFFTSVRGGSGISDPVVRYDRLTGRWFVIAITTNQPNRIVLAVSGTGTITGTSSFTFFFFQQDQVGTTPNADTGAFADYCTLGVDANALYIGCNMFNPSFYGTTGWVVRKSSMTSGGPIVVTAFRQISTSSSGCYAPRGVHNDDPGATEGYFIGPDTGVFGRIVIRRVSNPGGTPTISGNINITVATTTNPINVPAQGSTTALEAIDDRLFAAQVRRNKVNGITTLWTAHAIQVNSSGAASLTGGRNGMRWYELQNLTATPSPRQVGTLFDNAASSPRYYWMGSVTASGQGHAAVGASYAATDEFAGAATAGRLNTDTISTIRAVTNIISGAGAYNQVAGGRNRWGDYSFMGVDPADDMTIWAFQEYTNATNSWGVRVTRLIAPPPASLISASPPSLAQGAANASVVITGSTASGAGFFDTYPEFPNHLAAAVSGTGVTVNSVTFDSPSQVTLNLSVSGSAATGARTITITNPDGQSVNSASIFSITTGGCTGAAVTGHPASLTRCEGTGASFTVTASGTTPITYQWQKDTVPITGAQSPTYSILSVTTGDAGSYRCVVTNACGSATSNPAALTVQTAPVITLNPASQTICLGGSVTFSADATGSPTPTFQWQKNSIDIGGATSPTYTISGAAAGDAGSYRCVVTNPCGAVPTAAADLIVCRPDLNCDEELDFSDVEEFIALFSAGDPKADFNDDEELDFSDIEAFIAAYAAGC